MSAIPLHTVHLSEVAPEVIGDDIATRYFWIGRPEVMLVRGSE